MSKQTISQIKNSHLCKSPSPKRPKLDLGNESPHYADTSFLDDINIDEIVGYLTQSDSETLESDIDISHVTNQNIEHTTETALSNNNLETSNVNSECEESHSQVTLLEDVINSSLSPNKKSSNTQNSHKKTIINIDTVPTSSPNIIKNQLLNGSFTVIQPIKDSKPSGIIKDGVQSAEYKEINKSKNKPCLKDIVLSKETHEHCILEKYLSRHLKIKCCILSIIQYGQFSKLFKCKDSNGKEYVLKMLCAKNIKYFSGAHIERILRDIQCDISVENMFCVYLYTSFVIDGHTCFLMDYYPKTLREEMNKSNKPLSIYMMQDLARQLVSALTLLKNNHIVHSDIKPHHILLNSSNNKLKICGFDKAYYIETATVSPNHGTLNYRAPEVILGHSAGFSIDIWSTALVLHEMVTWRKLFSGWSNYDILHSQMQILGNLPLEMLNESRYGTERYFGNLFKTNFNLNNKKSYLKYFSKNDKIRSTVLAAYYKHWAPSRTKVQKNQDKIKINSFIRLLRKTIVLCPEKRLSIESVYNNPFIYEVYDH